MKKHFLLFMALFALVSVNKLFASGEASNHTTDAAYNPTSQSITATSLPFTLSDWNAEKFASNVWVPGSDNQLVTWSTSDNSFLFAGKDKDTKYNDNNCEQPFVIKLAGAAKQLKVKSTRSATLTGESYTGSGWKVYEWDGEKWQQNGSNQGYTDSEKSYNLANGTRYIMIASYDHGGGNRIFSTFSITKGDAGLSADKNALAFSSTNLTAQTVTVLNAYSGNKPSAAWKAGSTDKFTFTASQTGTADDGQTVYTITPKSGAVAGDNDVLVVAVGSMSVEIPVVVYNATDKSLPINLTYGGPVADAARFIGMCTHNKTSYDFTAKSITFFGGQSYATDVRLVTFPISDAPSMLSYTITANQEGQQWSGYQKPKITTFQSTDGSTWTQAGELKDFNGTENVNLELMSTTRYIKLEFSGIKGVGTLTNLKITKADPVPTKVWNIGTTLFERNDYSDIFKTNSDAQLTITVNSSNSLLSYANGKLTTAAIASSPQSAGSITVSAPATATFQAFETTLDNIQLVSNPAYLPATVNSKDVFDLLFSGQSSQDVSPNVQWNSELGVIELLRRSTTNDRYFELTIKGVPYQLSFDYKNDEGSQYGPSIEMWIKESVDGTTWTDVKTGIKPSNLSEYTSFGPYDLSSTTTKIRVYVKGTYAQHLFKNLTIISASPMLNVAESVVELKANTSQVFDNTVKFSVLKYQTITAKIEGAGFGLVKGDDAVASEITFTDADGLNNSTFQDCSFKVRYSGDAGDAVGKAATIKFYGDDNKDTEIGSVAVSVIAMPRLTFEVPTNGSYTYQYQGESVITVNEQKTRELVDAPYDVTLTANANVQGYKFMGWYEKDALNNKTYLSNSATFVTSIETTKTIGVEFVPSTTPIFIVKGQSVPYTDLNTACVAANGSGTVVLISDGTLPAGNYTVPEGVTLLVPFDNAYTCYTDMPGAWHGHYNPNNGQYEKSYSNDSRDDNSKEYAVLTLAEGASLNVNGTLSLSADRWCIYNTGNHGASIPNISGNFRLDKGYGLIDMKQGSSINIGNSSTKPNAKLYCWGRIRGEGTITAEENAEVRESLVFTDWRESDSLGWYAQNSKCFPFTQYYVQDIQVPITFNYGSKEVLVTGLFGVSTQAVGKGTMQLVGPNNTESLITIPQNGKFIKRYDIPTDRLILDFYDGVSFNAAKLKVSVSGINMDAPTSTHIFPITNNWTINYHPSSTPYTIKYDLALCSGAIMNIETGAHLQLLAGASLYVYDKDDWDKFASRNYIIPLFLPKYEREHGSYNGISTTTFTAGYGNYTVLTSRLFENLQDASIKVNGKFTIFGEENNIYKGTSYGQAISPRSNSGLYTTAGGANIYSDGGGQIIFKKGSGDQEITPQVYLAGRTVKKVPISPARLFNRDSIYVSTSDYPTSAEVTFYNKDGYWYEEETEANTIIINDENVNVDDTETPIADATYTIENAQMVEAATITVNTGSTLNVEAGGAVVTTNLALSTTPSYSDGDNVGASSQVTGEGSINATNVYIDIKMDPEKLNASNYYAFAVPFNVSAQAGENGVQKLDKDGNVSNATIDVDYRAYYYDGAKRAQNGSNGSAWVAVTSADTYQPGKFYLIEFASDKYNVYRFHKITDEKLDNTKDIDLNIYDNPISDGDNGWCGIANNSLQNTKLEIDGVEAVQVLNPTDNTFTPVMLADATFAVGTPMFAQVTGETSATHTSTQASPERRFVAQVEDKIYGHYTIRIAAEGATKKADQMFISASENANDSYTVGKDLAKMFMGQASVAQLWINRYGKKLAMSQTNLIDDVAEASLTLYAPKAGKYQVYLKTVPEDATLYLLEDGAAVANLNDGAYVVTLDKGENDQFGLRINAIKTIPGVVTSIDEAFVGKDLQKVLLDGVVYIVREGKLYNALGQQVK